MKTERTYRIQMLVALVAVFGFCPLALAGSFNWTGAADSNNWFAKKYIPDSDPPEYMSNWGTVGDPPIFPDSPTADVAISKPVGGWTAELFSPASIRFLTIGAGDDLTIHSQLRVYGNSINNAGNLAVNHTFSHLITKLRFDHNNTVLSGGGALTLSDNSGNNIYGVDGDERLTNIDNTIQGGGRLGTGTLALTNHSLINANVGAALEIAPNSGGVINTAIMQASAGGTLTLKNGTFTNTGAIIQALDGSEIKIDSATVIDGTRTTSGTGLVTVRGASALQDVINSGQVNVSGFCTLSGTFANNGELEVIGYPALSTYLKMSGTVTLTGGGVVTLTGNTTQISIRGSGGSGALVNLNNTISGGGRLGHNELELTNNGTIVATGTTPLAIDLLGTAGMTNEGLMRAEGAGGFDINDDAFTNVAQMEVLTGSKIYAHGKTYLQTAGTTRLEGLLRAKKVDLHGGRIFGTGTIQGNINVTGGTVSPGLSVGELVVDGDLNFADGGIWDVEIADANEADLLQVHGDATFTGGYIEVTILDFNAPEPNDSWIIMTADSLTGVETLSVQGSYSLSVNGTNLLLQFNKLPGDCDRDGDVDMYDFAVLGNHWRELSGMTWDDGDFNGDEKVDFNDLSVQAEHWLIGVGPLFLTRG